MPDDLGTPRPSVGHDDERLLADLRAAIAPAPAQPTRAEMAPMFEALADLRDVGPAVLGVRRGVRWVVLAGAAAAVLLVVGIIAETPRRPSRVASAPTTTTVSPAIDDAGRALVALEEALTGPDTARVATAAGEARTALERLTPDERVAFEPRATTLLAEADARTGESAPTGGVTTTTAPAAVETTTTTTAVSRTTVTTAKPATTTTTPPPTTATTTIEDDGEHSPVESSYRLDTGDPHPSDG